MAQESQLNWRSIPTNHKNFNLIPLIELSFNSQFNELRMQAYFCVNQYFIHFSNNNLSEDMTVLGEKSSSHREQLLANRTFTLDFEVEKRGCFHEFR